MLSTIAMQRASQRIFLATTSSSSPRVRNNNKAKKLLQLQLPNNKKLWLSTAANDAKATATANAEAAAASAANKTAAETVAETKEVAKSWWSSAEWWGAMGAIAGWGMSGAAIYDAALAGPEVISLNMTGVLIVYSSLFARWALVVKPRNLLLASCHMANVVAQFNQLRRALEHKLATGQEEEVYKMMRQGGMATVAGAVAIVGAPTVRKTLMDANWGKISDIAAADAGPFTVHFWAPMSKWLISGASFMELDRPTDKVSLPQYSALTMTGFFFTRYALLVSPINYVLCSVNIALFTSSAWHLGRKIKADYFMMDTDEPSSSS